ncbi:hypothetical protein [Sulfurimicrobium lacus]|nr:hypothetical protein [Sulfurimicrobium lacus]
MSKLDRTLLALASNYAPAQALMGEIYRHVGAFDRMVSAFAAALALEP